MKRAGLTLIELLVVIAAIILFTAISITTLQNSRQQAKADLCGSNIKQVVSGLIMYETENGTFPYAFDKPLPGPPQGSYPGNSTYDRMGWWWFNHLGDYFGKEQGKRSVIWCPSRQLRESKYKGNVLCGNYGVNESVCKSSHGRKSHAEFIGMPLCSTDISHPGRTLLVVDSGYSLISWWHVTDEPPITLGNTIEDTAYIPGLWINKERDLWPGQEWDAINGRHPNKTVNVGFVDGHISRAKADDLFVEKINNGYKNRSPIWVPK